MQRGLATVQDVLQRHGALTYVSGHLHGIFGPRLHSMHPGPDGGTLRCTRTACWFACCQGLCVALVQRMITERSCSLCFVAVTA